MEQERLDASKEFTQGSMDRQKETTEEEIRLDAGFTEAYKTVQSYLNPDEAQEGTQEEMANYGMQMVSDSKNALYTLDDGLGLAGTYAKFKDAPKEVKESMWYMMDSYERADNTWEALGRGLKSIGKDPSTYTGIGAGLKIFGTKAAGSIAMKRFKAMLLSGAVTGAFTGSEEFVKQEIQGMEAKDWDAIGEMTTIGAVLGVIAPPVIEGAVKGIVEGGKKLAKSANKGKK